MTTAETEALRALWRDLGRPAVPVEAGVRVVDLELWLHNTAPAERKERWLTTIADYLATLPVPVADEEEERLEPEPAASVDEVAEPAPELDAAVDEVADPEPAPAPETELSPDSAQAESDPEPATLEPSPPPDPEPEPVEPPPAPFVPSAPPPTSQEQMSFLI